jgi:opacity protein-like surface antigen
MKLTQSLVAIAALSTLSFAGGDINPITVFEQEPIFVPVETVPVPVSIPEPKAPVVVVKPPVVKAPPIAAAAQPLGLYLAGGLTAITASSAHEDAPSFFSSKKNQTRQLGFTGRLGYDFMDYLGAELRGTYGFAKVANGYSKYKQVGAYLKPNYDITKDLNLYGLIGASKSNHAGIAPSSTGLSYGAGLDYGVTDNISVFTDVVNYMDKSNVPESWGLTLGAGYQF